MLESLVTYNSSVSAVYMEVIAGIKCQHHILHLEDYFIQKIQGENFLHLCYNFCSPTYVELYILRNKQQLTFNAS